MKAERTLLTCEEIREKAGITRIVLPDHYYKDTRYDKWGSILLPDGRRLKGELFFDTSVQKVLKSAGVLHHFCDYVKYPRTLHLNFGQEIPKDDRILGDNSQFDGRRVVVTEKLDGENVTLYCDYMHARSIDGQNHPSRNWLKNFHSKMAHDIPSGWRICGENMFAKHTIFYDDLESYFYLFSVWDHQNRCLGWDETVEWAGLLGVKTVPVIYDGVWVEKNIKGLCQDTKREGFVVRTRDGFFYGDFRSSVAKFVNPTFRDKLKEEDTYHWRFRQIIKNGLKSD